MTELPLWGKKYGSNSSTTNITQPRFELKKNIIEPDPQGTDMSKKYFILLKFTPRFIVVHKVLILQI